MITTPPVSCVRPLDAATDEFIDAFNEFMLTQIIGFMLVVPEIAQTAVYLRLMEAARVLDFERQKHAAVGIFDSPCYDDELIGEILGGGSADECPQLVTHC